MRVKIDGQNAVITSKVALVSSAICMIQNEQREAVLRSQMPISQDIEGMNPPEKFILLRFTLYDKKSDSRSHVSHVRQMMALWNHMDALMCHVFPSNLGDLGLKWFDKLPAGSIETIN